MPTKIWLETIDVFSATIMHVLTGCKASDDCTCDGFCFEKAIGFNATDLLRLHTNCPRTIVQYSDGLDFVRNPKNNRTKNGGVA
jgi:hypothetical protein